MLKVFPAFVAMFIASILVLFAEYLAGRVLLLFRPTRYAGIKLVAMSGLFPKSIPKLCPNQLCDTRSCGNWTCPYFGSSVPRS